MHLSRPRIPWLRSTGSRSNVRPSVDRNRIPRMQAVTAKDFGLMNATDEQRLIRAKGYPYPRLDSSFIFCGGKAYTVDNSQWKGPEHLEEMLQMVSPAQTFDLSQYRDAKWHAVLAIGSNASPEQLSRKYKDPDVIIPVAQCVMHDFDVVYAPLVSSYGSCTATLQHSPGTIVEQYVTYLTTSQLERMLETEGAYFMIDLRNIDLKIGLSVEQYREGKEAKQKLGSILQFNHQKGCLMLPGEAIDNGAPSPVAFSAIASIDRRFPQRTQVEMLTTIKNMTNAQDTDLDTWILTNLDDKDHRRSIVAYLTSTCQPFNYSDYEIVSRIGDIHSKNVR